MNALLHHIDYLTRHHDCVIVPGLGAFVAQMRSASVDRELGLIYPPVRALGFNPAISHDDGLLSGSVARRGRIPYEQASAIVSESVGALRKQLHSAGAVVIPHVGSLRMVEGAIIFDPVKRPVEPYPTLTLTPVLESARAEAQARHKRNTEPVSRHGDFKFTVRMNRLRVAASVAVLVFLGMLLTTPLSVEHVDKATFTTPTIELPEPTILPLDQPRNAELNIAIPTPEIIDKPVERVVVHEVAGYPVSTDDRYFVIVASLPTRNLAERFIAESSTDGLSVLEADGKFRVYVASAPSQGAAQSLIAAQSLEVRFPGVWVYRK